MVDKVVSWKCERCGLPMYFLLEFEKPDWSVGFWGGYYGVILANDYAWEGLDTSEREDNRCRCEYTGVDATGAGWRQHYRSRGWRLAPLPGSDSPVPVWSRPVTAQEHRLLERLQELRNYIWSAADLPQKTGNEEDGLDKPERVFSEKSSPPVPVPGYLLSKRQTATLAFIAGFINQTHYAPSIRDIVDGCDYSSTSVVHSHVKALVRAGYMHQEANKSRALSVTPAGRDYLAWAEKNKR